MLNAEWLKLTRRPMTWILLSVFLTLMVVYFSAWFLVVALHEGTFTGGAVRLEVLSAVQIAQLRLQLSFPGIFGAVLGWVNGVGGICAVIMTAGMMGSEYTWGTLRMQLSRNPNRRRYLFIKLGALLLLFLAGIIIALSVGALMVLMYGTILGNVGRISALDLLQLPLSIARALYVLLPYVLFTFTCAIFGRSVIAGAGGGLVFLSLDASLGSVAALAKFDPAIQFLYELLIQPNINTLVVLNSSNYGLDQAILVRSLDLTLLPTPLHATLVVGVYSGFFLFASQRLLEGRDLGGAG